MMLESRTMKLKVKTEREHQINVYRSSNVKRFEEKSLCSEAKCGI